MSRYLGRLIIGIGAVVSIGILLPAQEQAIQRTAKALEQYRMLARDGDGALLPSTTRPVEAGQHYAGVPRLANLLRRLGDLPADSNAGNSEVYSPPLVNAVKRFQMRHGLEPDGRIGKGTLAELNTPLKSRVRQLELALERLRRLPYDTTRPAIVLNLPEFRLRAFNAESQPELEMKVIIGRAPKLKTPLLSAQLDSVLFRPYWNVPLSIQRNELVADIRKDPSYIAKNDFELVTPKGAVVSQESAGGTLLSQLRSGKLMLRQKPGPQNSLGRVKFSFPNKYDVYMHDTPAQSLFARARRDFSHGCIRVEKPEDLAVWVLRGESGWPRDRIAAAMQGAETVSVKLKAPIQVATIYVTAVAADNGEVYFFKDIYGEDAAFEKQLAEGGGEPTSGEPGPRPRE